jgi:regulator of sigma E protease
LSLLHTVLAFVGAILILVSLHEFGHYIVARWCGVKVLRFSVGFGKPFFIKKRGDTEWCLAPIPLGGYVKMVDTREGNVLEEDLPYAFDQQHPFKRILIVAAGPLTNLALAVLLYGASFSFGVTEIKPYIGIVEPSSVAAQAGFKAGDKVLSVNGTAVADWPEAITEIVLNLESGKVNVAVEEESGVKAQRVFDLAGTQQAEAIAQQKISIGLYPFRSTNVLGLVAAGSPAERAGLKKGDLILSVNGEKQGGWLAWSENIRNHPGAKLSIEYQRDQAVQAVQLYADSIELPDGSLIGRVGFSPQADQVWEQKVRHEYQPSVGEAFKMGAEKTYGYAILTVKFFGKLLTGQASLSHISGPVTIADAAGKYASLGLQSYVEFLALISVSLGIMNLLPIPVLDGGHLVYYTAEWLRGKPLSERVQMMGMRVGLMAMLALMMLAFFNDITRLLG